MKFDEMLSGLRNGKIKIDFSNHHNNFFYKEELEKDLKDRLIERWTDQEVLFGNSPINEVVLGRRFFTGEFDCKVCGKKLRFCLKDENTIVLTTLLDHPDYEIPTDCTYPDGMKPIVSYINVPSGDLLFFNYIRHQDFELEDKCKYANEYSLSTYHGRIGLAKFYSSKNLGYAQMGNMSVSVMQDKMHKNRVFICSPYLENEKFLKNKEIKGPIHLDVWRWHCIDSSFLNDAHKESIHGEIFSITVPSGRYKIIDYYAEHNEKWKDENCIYSLIKKVA